jgi:four helix bundle protein
MAASYRDLIAWQKAMDMVEGVYRATRSWPRDEIYGLTSQVRRAAVSVPANVAEGKGRIGSAEFAHHLSMAHGSLCEMETHLQLGHRLGYLTEVELGQLLSQAQEVGRLLQGLIRSLRSTPRRPEA